MEKWSKSLRFLIPSVVGLIMFVIPLPYGRIIPLEGIAEVNIGVGMLANLFTIIFDEYLLLASCVVISSSAVLSLVAKVVHFKSSFFNGLFNVSPFWLACRCLGATFTAMVYFGVGPDIIISDLSGGAMIELIPSLLAIFFVTGYLLPLIIDFGLMDLLGTLISRHMYWLFKVPGRAAIDTISSWLGDGTLGVMITDKQYRQGYYTTKEASIIAVCFSLVSLPFSTVIAGNVGMMPLFAPFYGTVCIASFCCAIILPRIYPISKMPDTTYNGVPHQRESYTRKDNILRYAWIKAIIRANNAPTTKQIVVEGMKFTADLYMSLLPLCMAWGTLALIVANYTPFFDVVSMPFEYILRLCDIPNAHEAAPAIFVGFTDMFIPSIMVSGEEISPITKFIIGTLSVCQMLFLTETGAVILKSKIPLRFFDLLLIFLIRTAISLPIIIVVAKCLF
ncbi:MAG: YjiH family protein [Rikenellaceae bacterium]